MFHPAKASNINKTEVSLNDALRAYLDYHEFIGSKKNTIRWLNSTLKVFLRYLAENHPTITTPNQVRDVNIKEFLAVKRTTNEAVS